MKAEAVEIEDKVEELLVLLDRDVEHIRRSLSWLNELRALVVKRDDVELAELLESIQAESDSYKSHELKRDLIRKDLADALDCGLEQVTLSKLETVVTAGKQAEVAAKKAELKELTNELKKEHLSTAMLLSDCARFNRQLFQSIFDPGKMGMVYYNSRGTTKRGMTEAFVNLQF